MKRSQVVTRVVVGIIALTAWLAFFSAGQLVETTKYRRLLAPEAAAKQAKASGANTDLTSASEGSAATAFIVATLCFTPINLVFLTLLAGLLGGCASNVVADMVPPDQKSQMSTRRLMYLEETPWSAVMRSFIVYLCVVAGLYLGVDDPFKDPTPGQYIRLAGMLSALAFVVGFDPSRIEQWIRLVPSPQPSQVVTVRGKAAGVEITAAQGPAAGQPNVTDGQPVTARIELNSGVANSKIVPERRLKKHTK